MKALREQLGVIENMGLVDRMLRTLIGLLLLVPIIVVVANVEPIGWQFYATIGSTYLLLTAMLGWDPFYAMFHARTCGASEKNRCGSFEYEKEAMLGHHPDHDKAYEVHALKPGERVQPFKYDGGRVL